jgi:hypothetical protein
MLYSLEQFCNGRNLNPELLSVLEALDETYDGLHFLSRDTKWINFRVQGMGDEALFSDIEEKQDDIFDDLSNFQILRPSRNSTDRGVFLHHLSSPSLRVEYLAGFGYY